MAQFYEGIGVVGAPAASSELAYLRPIRQGVATIAAGTATKDVYDSAITANSLVVATIGTYDSGTVSAQTVCGVRIEPNVKFTIGTGTNIAAGEIQKMNWAVLKY